MTHLEGKGYEISQILFSVSFFQDQDFSGKVIAPEDENGKVVWACYPLEDVWKV